MNNKMEPPKRRRLKVVRACRECRRKKTKCDGEKICSACIKSQTECQYITSKQVSSDHTLETIGTTTILTSTRQKKHHHYHQQKKHHYQLKHQQKYSQPYPSLPLSPSALPLSSSQQNHHHQENSSSSLSPSSFKSIKSSSKKQSVSITVTINSIEKRLSTIEDQLRYIFQYHCFQPPPLPPPTSSSSTTSLPPLVSSLSPISSPSSTSSKNDPILNNDSSSSLSSSSSSSSLIPYQNEKNISSISPLLTLPPLQSSSSTNSLYNNDPDNMFHKKIPLLRSIFHDK